MSKPYDSYSKILPVKKYSGDEVKQIRKKLGLIKNFLQAIWEYPKKQLKHGQQEPIFRRGLPAGY